VAVRGATHFMMEWIPPDEPNGVIIGYRFSYQSSKTITCVSLLADHEAHETLVLQLNTLVEAMSCLFHLLTD